MKRRSARRPATPAALAALLAALLAGCASVDVARPLGPASEAVERDGLAAPTVLAGAAQRAERDAAVQSLLARPLDADAAVRVALLNSPALQASLATSVAAQNRALQSGLLARPHFSFERARRGDEVEITRALGIGLGDLLTWPLRRRVAEREREAERWRAAAEVLRSAHEARSAWVRAVAAQQRAQYQQQVLEAAEASAELARRMQSVGNFSRLQRAREQAFEADARAQAARARLAATVEREALVRALGLNAAQAQALQLPDRLPDLPEAAREPEAVTREALERRLDLQLAHAQWRLARAGSAAGAWTSWLDLGASAFRSKESAQPVQRGWELELSLPLLDLGGAQRAAAGADELAALARLDQAQVEAGSLLRERYAAYRTAFDLARQQRDEVVPLRRTIADEMLLQYNGMLVGVFELLADARAQIGSVIGALDAQRDFWLADAALSAAVRGIPSASVLPAPGAAAAGAAEAGH